MDGVFTGSEAGREAVEVVRKVVGVDEGGGDACRGGGDGGGGWEALMRGVPDGMGMWPRHMGKLLQIWRGVAGEARAVMEGGFG